MRKKSDLRLKLEAVALDESLFVYNDDDFYCAIHALQQLKPKKFRSFTWYGDKCCLGKKLFPDSDRPAATQWQFKRIV